MIQLLLAVAYNVVAALVLIIAGLSLLARNTR